MEVLDIPLSELDSLRIRSRGFFRGDFDVIGEGKLTTVSHSRLTDVLPSTLVSEPISVDQAGS